MGPHRPRYLSKFYPPTFILLSLFNYGFNLSCKIRVKVQRNYYLETTMKVTRKIFAGLGTLSLPRFQGQCLESCFYTDPMKSNDHNECPVYATSLQR